MLDRRVISGKDEEEYDEQEAEVKSEIVAREEKQQGDALT